MGRFLNTVKLPIFVNRVNRVENSDYLLLLGDSANGNSLHLNDLDMLEKINKRVIYIFGNHDYQNAQPPIRLIDGLKEKLEGLNFTILENEVSTIGEDQNTIYLAGVKDTWSQEEDYSILDKIQEDDTVIFLGHNPDVLLDLDTEQYKNKVDLVLSGHTHGGEVRLPYIGPIGPIPTELPRKYDKGYFEYNGIPLYITSGIGSGGTRIRLFNPPEIVVITIE